MYRYGYMSNSFSEEETDVQEKRKKCMYMYMAILMCLFNRIHMLLPYITSSSSDAE